MIIKRKYELIGVLVDRDPESKDILMEALLTRNNQEEAKEILECDSNSYLYVSGTDLCIPQFDQVMKKIDELDEKKPYDNGLTYSDVSEVISLSSKKGKATELWMISCKPEMPKRIVQIIAVEYEDGKTYTIEPWEERYLF